MEADKQLIERCLRHDREAQEELYGRYAARMYGICLRYAGNALEAQDILQEGFIRVFQRLNQFRRQGRFERWLRKIFINTAITLANRELKFLNKEPLDPAFLSDEDELSGLSRLCQQELLELIQRLPAGYRMVFNLYVIEGYSHREIGTMLKISTNTSKSQLAGAKRTLRAQLTKPGNGNGREQF